MTQEEEARAYDEAIERARRIKNGEDNWRYSDLTEIIPALEEVLPELAESEDERIMSRIIDGFKNFSRSASKWNNIPVEEVIAYLEKQKEKMTAEEYESSELFQLKLKTKYANGYQDGLAQKEQKPAESISQLTVQGKGVYKICPRCKERMVRDDSMVYTSMPPQYRYECPKCGEREFDTVMYDNPEMEEQKPNSTEDMPYITDEHFYEREPADSFKYKLAEYMTRCCTKKEGPYGYEYGISAESILKMAEEELLKRGVVQKPAEWSEEDKMNLNGCICSLHQYGYMTYADFLKHLPERFNLQPKTEWSEEDETALGDLMWCIEQAKKSAKDENDMGNIWFAENWVKNRLKSLRPSWKPSEVCYGPKGDPDPAGVWKPSEHQMNILKAVKDYVGKGSGYWGEALGSLIDDLEKLL